MYPYNIRLFLRAVFSQLPSGVNTVGVITPAYKSVKSPTQGHLAINRLRKDSNLQMPSPGTYIITHFVQTATWSPNQCLSPSVWNTQVLGWWHTKYRGVSEGSWSYQRLWWAGNVCHGWGEGSVNMHSMPAPGSLFSIWTTVFTGTQSHQLNLMVTSWTIFLRIEPFLTSRFFICVYNLLFLHLPQFPPPTFVLSPQKHPQFLDCFLTSLSDSTVH